MHRLAALVVVTVAVTAVRLTAQDPSPVERLFIEYWEFRLSSQPELATLSGRTDYDTRWRDWSREGRERADEQLASERFRAVRLVVDTGMHAFGWPREQALDYFRTHAPAESEAEIDRYIARPGQALAYKLGELRIKALRRKAEQALGSRFDVREFHDAVLREGRVPLDFLDGQVEAYITAVQAGSSN